MGYEISTAFCIVLHLKVLVVILEMDFDVACYWQQVYQLDGGFFELMSHDVTRILPDIFSYY